MGCAKSSESENRLKDKLRAQSKEIQALQDANAQIKETVEKVLMEQRTKKPVQSRDLEGQLRSLEEKLQELTNHMSKQRFSDTLSRDSGSQLAHIPNLSPQPQPLPPSSNILSDPTILAMLERQKQRLMKKPPQPNVREDSIPSLANSGEFSHRK